MVGVEYCLDKVVCVYVNFVIMLNDKNVDFIFWKEGCSFGNFVKGVKDENFIVFFLGFCYDF